MSLPKPPKHRPSKAVYSTSANTAQNQASQKANNELLFKGILCSLIGLGDRKSTRLNSSHIQKSRMPSSA